MAKENGFILAVLAVLIFVVLPTGTIEDVFTTIPIINAIGAQGYILLALGLIILYGEVKNGN